MERLKANGLTLANLMIVGFPNAIYNRPGKDEDIEKVIQSIKAAGRVGLPVVEYNWYAHRAMEGYFEETGRAGAGWTGFDFQRMKDLPPLPEEGAHTLDEMWTNITYFLKAVVPEAEKAGVRLALHPNDPPAPISRGSQQIMGTIDGWKKLIGIVDSPSNGITFDCGVTREMGDDPGRGVPILRLARPHQPRALPQREGREAERALHRGLHRRGGERHVRRDEGAREAEVRRLVYPEHPRGIDYDREQPNFRSQYPGGGGYAGVRVQRRLHPGDDAGRAAISSLARYAVSADAVCGAADPRTGSRIPTRRQMKSVPRLAIVTAMAALLAPLAVHAQLFSLTKDQMIAWTADNPFERFDDGRPKVPDGLIDRARGLSSEEIFAILPGKGFRNQYEDGFHVLHPDKKLVGRAFTVQFMPMRPDLDTVINAKAKAAGLDRMYNQVAIDMLQPGDVLVVDLFGKTDGGTIVGDNLFYYVMKATKGAGLVVDGAIRDLDGISQMDMPAYFRSAHPSAISNVIISGINVPVRIGNATVMPGDLVVGDSEGVYFIPPALVQPVVDNSDVIHIHDEWTRMKFDEGKYKSSEIYGSPKDPALKKEYEDYLKKRLEDIRKKYSK